MKIRVMGTKEECTSAAELYKTLENSEEHNVAVTVSELYPNRGTDKIFRVYIEVIYLRKV